MIWLMVDVLISNLTKYTSYFFLYVLNEDDYVKVLTVALALDFIVLRTYFINVVLLSVLYCLKKYVCRCKLNLFGDYALFNMFNLVVYYLMMNGIYNYFNWMSFLQVALIYLVFISIMFLKGKSINIYDIS